MDTQLIRLFIKALTQAVDEYEYENSTSTRRKRFIDNYINELKAGKIPPTFTGLHISVAQYLCISAFLPDSEEGRAMDKLIRTTRIFKPDAKSALPLSILLQDPEIVKESQELIAHYRQ